MDGWSDIKGILVYTCGSKMYKHSLSKKEGKDQEWIQSSTTSDPEPVLSEFLS